MTDLVTFKHNPDVTELFSRLLEKAIQENQLPADVKAAMAKHDEQNEKILVVVRYLLQMEVIFFDEDTVRGIIYKGGLIGLTFPEDPEDRRAEQNAMIDTLIDDLDLKALGADPIYNIVNEDETEDEIEDLGDGEYDHLRSNVVDIESVDFELMAQRHTQALDEYGYSALDLNNSLLERDVTEVQLGYFIQQFPEAKSTFMNIDNISQSATARSEAYNALHENITAMLRLIFTLGAQEGCLLASLLLDDGMVFNEETLVKFTMNLQDHFLNYATEVTQFIAEERKYLAGLDAIGFYLTAETGNETGEDDLERVLSYIDSIDVDDKDGGNKVLKWLRAKEGSRNLLGLINGLKRYAFFREIEVQLENGDLVKIKDLVDEDEGGDWEEDYNDYDGNDEQ